VVSVPDPVILELDLADEESAAEILRKLQPWAEESAA
jgi:hypothetical protein